MAGVEANIAPLKKELFKVLRSHGIIVLEEDMSEALNEECRRIADEVLYEAVNTLNQQGITDTGVLANSGTVESNEEGGWDVVFAAEHAEWIEYGAPAHPVSAEGVKKIEEWVERKLQPTPEKGESQAACNRRVANAIVWNIRKQGMDPKPFLRPALENVMTKEGGSR